jgi:hypothetical protein
MAAAFAMSFFLCGAPLSSDVQVLFTISGLLAGRLAVALWMDRSAPKLLNLKQMRHGK